MRFSQNCRFLKTKLIRTKLIHVKFSIKRSLHTSLLELTVCCLGIQKEDKNRNNAFKIHIFTSQFYDFL